MYIHCIQHVAFESIGCIGDWARLQGHTTAISAMHEAAPLPNVELFDWLVIMGGPMGVHDEALYPWLREEKLLIERALSQEKTIVGICLGAQLLADVLGAAVYGNGQKEIGWFPVQPTEQGKALGLFPEAQEHPVVFHWHGDTFDIPSGAVHVASSEACANQAFLYNNKVLGLQFHGEVDRDAVDDMITHGRHELLPSGFVQTEGELRRGALHTNACNALLCAMLDRLANNTVHTEL